MQVLLNKDVKTLGYRGDIINVKNGYFRNYLFPRGLAEVANAKVKKLAEERNEKRTLQKERVLDNVKDVLKKLKGLSVTIKAKVSDKGKLYGSITEADVVEAIKAGAKVELEKDFIKMDHFKELGEHKAKVHLGEGVEEEITVVLEAEE
ncbi:MAG: 50S ribosomal protein L9 [Nitrospirota bacterium]